MEVEFETNLNLSDQEKDEVLNMLPHSFKTKVTSYSSSERGIYMEIRTNISSKEEALTWKAEFEEKSKTSYNIDSNYQEDTLKTLFKRVYHCSHNTMPRPGTRNPRIKHTKCQAKLIINVKQKTMKQSKDIYLKIFPCQISMRLTHNHSIDLTDLLRLKKPSDSVRNKFVEWFTKGYSPSTAYELFKMNLQDEYEDYSTIVADGSKFPSKKWCCQLYQNIFKKQYENPTENQIEEAINNSITSYNTKCEDISSIVSDENDIIVICSPLMKRVHKCIKSSSKIMYVDSSGNMDRHNTRVYLLLCPSAAGALPLGIIITNNESEDTITKALWLLKTILSDWGFYGNSSPEIIITDDSTALRESIKTCFPDSVLLLCKFNLLQTIMRYLWDRKHAIDQHDRLYIYNLFYDLINNRLEEDFLFKFREFIDDYIVQQYPHFIKFIAEYKIRSQEWAMCYRTNLFTLSDTNYYCESSFKVLKDKILHKAKDFNMAQMFDYLTLSLENYYEKKISDGINNSPQGNLEGKYFFPGCKIDDLQCDIVGNNIYKVMSKNNECFVNTYIEMCTCFKGNAGGPCKHKYAVAKKYNLSQLFLLINDAEEKLLLAQIINCDLPVSWAHLTDCEIEISDSIGDICVSPEQEKLTDTEKTLEEVFNIFLEKLKTTPNLFLDPVNEFCKSVTEMNTDSELIYAMNTFGAYSKKSESGKKSKQKVQGGEIGNGSQEEHSYNKRLKCEADLPPSKKRLTDSLSYIVEQIMYD